jgi:anti-sigma regulatory factor (Ser/Thr protein kinase)
VEGVLIRHGLESAAYGLFVAAEPVELMRVLSNLIDNAVEAFGPRGGTVTLDCELSADRIVIRVKDNGPGIDPRVLEQLGEKGITFGKPRGIGLGLYHARRTAEASSGSLTIESALGIGTIVFLTLPMLPTPPWYALGLKIARGDSVVVIDDDEMIYEMWKQRLRELGGPFQTRYFRTLSDARSWCRKATELATNTLFLVDYEFSGSESTGLDLIGDLGLEKHSFLVTGRAEQKDVVTRCLKMGVQIIPKSAIHIFPLSVSMCEEG